MHGIRSLRYINSTRYERDRKVQARLARIRMLMLLRVGTSKPKALRRREAKSAD